MEESGREATKTIEESDIGDSRLVLSIFRNHDAYLVIDTEYQMYLVYRERAHELPQNWVFKNIALLLVSAVVVHHVTASIQSAFCWVGSQIDRGFGVIYAVGQATSGFFASERTEQILSNIKEILAILAILLFMLDQMGVIDVTMIPRWLLPL